MSIWRWIADRLVPESDWVAGLGHVSGVLRNDGRTLTVHLPKVLTPAERSNVWQYAIVLIAWFDAKSAEIRSRGAVTP